MLKFAAVLLAGVSASAAAIAADLPNGFAGPGLMRGDSAYNWSGIYAGASAGRVGSTLSAELADPVFGTSRAKGFVGTLQAGFNKQAGGLVFGIEADFSLSNARGDNRRTVSGKYGDYTMSGAGNLETRLANIGTVRARLGYALENVLVYGTAGYAFGRQRLDMTGTITGVQGTTTVTAAQAGSTSNTMAGWALGAGLEYAFGRGMSVKAEYLRLHFNPSTVYGDTWAASEATSNINLFRTGFNFRI
ncbi:MAG: porin [Hyphomicrobiales bacterium]|nr:porin [Hyphomicrobiales bacterium]